MSSVRGGNVAVVISNKTVIAADLAREEYVVTCYDMTCLQFLQNSSGASVKRNAWLRYHVEIIPTPSSGPDAFLECETVNPLACQHSRRRSKEKRHAKKNRHPSILFGDIMVPNITPIMENQMEKKMENEMETGII